MEQSRVKYAAALLALQFGAAAFFLADTVWDASRNADGEGTVLSGLEIGLALALVAAIGFGAVLLRQMVRDAHRREEALALAKGALGDVVARRFGDWGLSKGEADVAMFAMKGCSIAEIASMRGSAEGTVRAQLSQVYAKAGVSSQSGFVALFVEELLD
ncbi:helix-turn-helix transcriptional regulator [Qipengyuania soli]|uniref:helix-turn-helix transcriptional regulator n=1 Tax=Qipengyuania soli TaxID=2782568 RepID=UPI001910FC37|nr:hypothetical protein [Qipengyuania soli]